MIIRYRGGAPRHHTQNWLTTLGGNRNRGVGREFAKLVPITNLWLIDDQHIPIFKEAKTANDDIYAGKDGNVYKRDSNGNWSKYDNGNWDPVDKSTGGQHKTGGGDSTLKSRQGTAASQTSPNQQRSADLQQRAQAPAGQNRQGVTPVPERQGGQAATQLGQGRSSASSETMQQLNQEAAARRQGAAREQTFTRGAGAARYGGGRRR